MEGTLRVGILGCGTIGGFVLDAVVAGGAKNAEVVIVCGRSERSKGRRRVIEYGIKWVTEFEEMLDADLDVIIEAASHQALERYGALILKNGIDLIPASIGALVDAQLYANLINAASHAGSILYIPSGGIGGLDAVKAIADHEVQQITMTSRKPPGAWKGIPYVDQLNLDLENLTAPTVLFEGPARDCVKEFPQNINIAAALSLAGLGFAATRIHILADPTVTRNIHEIHCKGDGGEFTVTMENIPVADNPKTTYMACYSVLAALKSLRSPYRIGT